MSEVIDSIQVILMIVGALTLASGFGFMLKVDTGEWVDEGHPQKAHLLKKKVQEARGLDLVADEDAEQIRTKVSDFGERVVGWGAIILGVAFVLGPSDFFANISGLFFS